MDIDEIKGMLEYAEKMSRGIDPTTNLAFCEDTVLNSPKIKQYNLNVAIILEGLLKSYDKTQSPNSKLLFNMSQDEKESFDYSDGDKSISSLVYQMNGYCEPYMKKLHATDITKWLQKKGYLETKETECGMIYKAATKKGNELGIFNYRKKNKYGNEYSVNLYNVQAQKFVVNNIEMILQDQ